MNLKNKKVLLTGASGGLGSELARQLHQEGAQLVLVGRNAEVLDKLTLVLNQDSGAKAEYIIADISNAEGRSVLINSCKNDHQDIDVIINNAGINEFALLTDSNGKTYDDMLQINLAAPIHLSHQLLPQLQKRDSAMIINVGSTLGSLGLAGYSVYCASKFGLRGFTEALRRELYGSNVTVLYFAPRAINTGMNSESVDEMNVEMGSKSDPVDWVTKQLVDALKSDKGGQLFVGWPEKIIARLNGVLPAIVDQVLKSKLALVKKYSALNKAQ